MNLIDKGLMTESIRCWCGSVHIIHVAFDLGIVMGERRSLFSGFCYACGRDLKGLMTIGEFPPRRPLASFVILWDWLTRQSFASRRRKRQ